MRFLILFWSAHLFAAFNLTWGMPALSLDSNPPIGDTDSNAFIAMDPDGNAVATWSRTTGNFASENIWAAVYNHSLRIWTGAVKISGEGSAANSQTAIDASGNAIFVWEEGFPTRIYYRTLSKEGVWAPDLSMSPAMVHFSKNAQTFPQIAIDKEGNALAIWTEFFNGINHVFGAHKPFDSSWIDVKEISSGGNDALLVPSKALVINEAGNGFAIWQEDLEIHGARYIQSGWSPSFFIASGASPSVGIDASGDVIIVWSQNDAIYSKAIQNGQLSNSPLKISHPDYTAKRPHVGVDASGNAIVVYERYNSLHKFIAAASLAKGASIWAPSTDISAPSPFDAAAAGYPVFAMNAIGDGVAIWKEWTGENMVIQGAGFSLDTWSPIRTLSSPAGNAGSTLPGYDISVALNDAGNILAIWPEDPLKTGAGQIKATAGVGLANEAPKPPLIHPLTIFQGVVTGKQVLHRFPAHADLINILDWEPSGEDIAHYNVYRGSLSSLIATTASTRYEDHQRTPRKKETYLITSVNSYGQESSPITIVVNPL